MASDTAPWQSELGMLDTSFLMQLDGFHPQTEHCESTMYSQSFKGGNIDQNSLGKNGGYVSPVHLSSEYNLDDTLHTLKEETIECLVPRTNSTFQPQSEGSLSQPNASLWSELYQTKFEGIGNVNSKCPSINPIKQSGCSRDHIMAERKRREKLSQRFIALSAMVPGLKKKDKASVLGDAVKYVKQMQERLKELEAQMPKKSSMAISQRDIRPASFSNCCRSESDNNIEESTISYSFEYQEKPEIEVQMVGNHVLIQIQCRKEKGMLAKCLAELERLHMTVETANVISFSEINLLLTFSAKLEDGFEYTAEEILEELHKFFDNTK